MKRVPQCGHLAHVELVVQPAKSSRRCKCPHFVEGTDCVFLHQQNQTTLQLGTSLETEPRFLS
jgi:hypothetical protein